MSKTKLLVAGVGVFSTLVILLLIYFFAFTTTGGEIWRAMNVTSAAMSAPGAREVGSVSGCKSGAVFATPDLWELERWFREANPDPSTLPPRVVYCRVEALETPPTCAAVAAAYDRAGETDGGFVVVVTQQLASRPVCQETFP